ncbi:Uncharacterised protein [uncultured archaeon]|nr:Uncharacterised protein [uncultured archaeon]
MRIGIILHGPEIVDEGGAKRIIEILRTEHDIIAKLGGTMGRTAVLDAGLEDIIDISEGMTPSQTINALKGRIDLAVLLNHGKTPDTGEQFGCIVASRLDLSMPFIHIERPDGEGRIIYYDNRSKRCAEYIRKVLMKHGNYNIPIEKHSPLPLNVEHEGDRVIRRVLGALPGENIRVDGIVIGHVTSAQPEIVCVDGRVSELRGGMIKQHGLEKLNNRNIDLFTAKVKTGNIRRSKHEPRIKTVKSHPAGVAIIDHCAESTFDLVKDAGMVITVGDDTTAIAADILARLGIPIIGITDGDLDCILEDTTVAEGSVIIRVREGFDDIVGKEVFEKIFKREAQIQIQEKSNLLARIIGLAKKNIIEIKYY